MKKIILSLILPTLIFANTTIQYNSDIDISEFAVSIESTTGLCLIVKSTSDIQDGYISRKGNKTTLVLNEYISTSTVIPIINSAVGQEGKITNPESGFTQVETTVGLTFILASIFLLIKTKNAICLLPIIIIVGYFVYKRMKENSVLKK